MADDLLLELVTPEKLAFSGKVEEVTIPGSEGEFGVLRGHAALLSAVQVGELSFVHENKRYYYAVTTGYAEVLSGKVTVLVESAERSDTIDKDEVRKLKAELEAQLQKVSKEDPKFLKISEELKIAETRLKVAEKA
ncbi:MAG: ATP synthase F1 subunit epsilon [Syntrophales bacterium]|nr:ATP synthase F1 subunit epsilon [Syntrophales bacterium]